MKFERNSEPGELVAVRPSLRVENLSLYLRKTLRGRPEAKAFLANVGDIAEALAPEDADKFCLTPGAMRGSLLAIELAAHTMQSALLPLADGGQTFSVLDSHFGYLLIRARDAGAPAGDRANVPTLPEHSLDLTLLLTRIHSDLQTLRVGCVYASGKLLPTRNISKDREAMVATDIAMAYQAHFGEAPPQRGWFAPFVEYVGAEIGLKVGHAIVGTTVANMTKRPGVKKH